jgi:serine protease Do
VVPLSAGCAEERPREAWAAGADATLPDAPVAFAQEPAAAAPREMRQAAEGLGESRRTAIVRAASRVAPAVVTINTLRTERVRPRSMWESFFLPPNARRRVSGLGSGFVIDGDEGLILTNDHVIQDADRVLVTFPDGRDFEADVVGSDPLTDLAVIRVAVDTALPQAPLGTSEALFIGEWVVAIGNPFGYLLSNNEPTVTAGVVSAVGRHIVNSSEEQGFYLGMIQTDASINPGNSGGPLINALGQVIGVNSSIFSRSGGSEGLGFAIPIDRALKVAGDLVADGEVRRPWLGLEVGPAEADDWGRSRGVMITGIVGGSPAADAGLRPGRRILAVNDRRLAAPLDWENVLLDLRPGDEVRVRLEEAGDVVVRAGDLPSVEAERVQVLEELELITLTPQIRAERGVASERGALVVEASPAVTRQIGLRPGDVLVQVNNARVADADEAARIFQRLPAGRTRLVVERGGGYVFQDFIWRP